MTKFHYMSDLHLEFGHLPKIYGITGENLILAGDITVLGYLHPKMNDAQSRKTRDRTETFFRIVCENFKRVFYVTGNHESYKFDIDLEAALIRQYLPGVIHLQNKSIVIDNDVVIVGGTLWTDFNRNNNLAHMVVGNSMNDFRLIQKQNSIFSTRDAYEEFQTTLEFLTHEIETHKDKKIVVVTHHAPAFCGLNPEHLKSGDMNYGYFSDLEKFILDRPQIVKWIYGHTHKQGSDFIGTTELLTNAQGYYGYESVAYQFNPDTWFEV